MARGKILLKGGDAPDAGGETGQELIDLVPLFAHEDEGAAQTGDPGSQVESGQGQAGRHFDPSLADEGVSLPPLIEAAQLFLLAQRLARFVVVGEGALDLGVGRQGLVDGAPAAFGVGIGDGGDRVEDALAATPPDLHLLFHPVDIALTQADAGVGSSATDPLAGGEERLDVVCGDGARGAAGDAVGHGQGAVGVALQHQRDQLGRILQQGQELREGDAGVEHVDSLHVYFVVATRSAQLEHQGVNAAPDPVDESLDPLLGQMRDAGPVAQIAAVDFGVGADLVLGQAVVPQLHLHLVGDFVQAGIAGVEEHVVGRREGDRGHHHVGWGLVTGEGCPEPGNGRGVVFGDVEALQRLAHGAAADRVVGLGIESLEHQVDQVLSLFVERVVQVIAGLGEDFEQAHTGGEANILDRLVLGGDGDARLVVLRAGRMLCARLAQGVVDAPGLVEDHEAVHLLGVDNHLLDRPVCRQVGDEAVSGGGLVPGAAQVFESAGDLGDVEDQHVAALADVLLEDVVLEELVGCPALPVELGLELSFFGKSGAGQLHDSLMQVIGDADLAQLDVVGQGEDEGEKQAVLGDAVAAVPLASRRDNAILAQVHLVAHILGVSLEHRLAEQTQGVGTGKVGDRQAVLRGLLDLGVGEGGALFHAPLVDQTVEFEAGLGGCGIGTADPLAPLDHRIALPVAQVDPAGRVEQVVALVATGGLVVVAWIDGLFVEPVAGDDPLAGGRSGHLGVHAQEDPLAGFHVQLRLFGGQLIEDIAPGLAEHDALQFLAVVRLAVDDHALCLCERNARAGVHHFLDALLKGAAVVDRHLRGPLFFERFAMLFEIALDALQIASGNRVEVGVWIVSDLEQDAEQGGLFGHRAIAADDDADGKLGVDPLFGHHLLDDHVHAQVVDDLFADFVSLLAIGADFGIDFLLQTVGADDVEEGHLLLDPGLHVALGHAGRFGRQNVQRRDGAGPLQGDGCELLRPLAHLFGPFGEDRFDGSGQPRPLCSCGQRLADQIGAMADVGLAEDATQRLTPGEHLLFDDAVHCGNQFVLAEGDQQGQLRNGVVEFLFVFDDLASRLLSGEGGIQGEQFIRLLAQAAVGIDQQLAGQGDPFGVHHLFQVAGPEFGVDAEERLHRLLVHLGLDLIDFDHLPTDLDLALDHPLLDEQGDRFDPVVDLDDPVGIGLLAILFVAPRSGSAVDVVASLAEQILQVLFLAGMHFAEGVGVGQIDRLARVQALQLEDVCGRGLDADVEFLAKLRRQIEQPVGQAGLGGHALARQGDGPPREQMPGSGVRLVEDLFGRLGLILHQRFVKGVERADQTGIGGLFLFLDQVQKAGGGGVEGGILASRLLDPAGQGHQRLFALHVFGGRQQIRLVAEGAGQTARDQADIAFVGPFGYALDVLPFGLVVEVAGNDGVDIGAPFVQVFVFFVEQVEDEILGIGEVDAVLHAHPGRPFVAPLQGALDMVEGAFGKRLRGFADKRFAQCAVGAELAGQFGHSLFERGALGGEAKGIEGVAGLEEQLGGDVGQLFDIQFVLGLGQIGIVEIGKGVGEDVAAVDAGAAQELL